MNTSVILPELVMTGDFVVRAGWVLGPRRLSAYEIIYFPKETGSVYCFEDREYKLDQPCFVLTRPDRIHTFRSDPQRSTRHLFVRFTWPIDAVSASPITILSERGPEMIPAREATVIPILLRRILEICEKKSDNHKLRCEMLLYSVLCELEDLAADADRKPEREVPPPLAAAQNYIQRNIRNPQLTVAKVAEEVGWSMEHFSRQYSHCFGISPKESIVRQRVELACELMLQETWSIKQIAYLVGFADEHYFSRCFHKLKGLTASMYRKKYAHPFYRHLAPTEDISAPYRLNSYFRFP